MNESNDKGLRIALDARWIFEKISGVGRVTENLIRHLPIADKRNHYIFIFDDAHRMERIIKECALSSFINAENVIFPYSIFSLKSQMKLPRFLKRNKIDVFHSTNFMMPLRRCRAKTVITIHDLIPLIFPDLTPKSRKNRFFRLYKLIMKRIMQIADVVTADSKNTEEDILRFFPNVKGKTRVVYCGIDDRYFEPMPFKAHHFLHERYGIKGPIIITAGRADPYKNTLGLVKAFEMLLPKCVEKPHLVIVGEDDPRYPEVHQYVADNLPGGTVTFTGYLDEKHMPAAYASADIMVHPSMYEGFGLPPLEAMAVGTPVISSDKSSLPEVLGDAAIYVDPCNIEGISNAINELLRNPEKRKSLSECGKKQASKYRWENAAKEMVRIYEEAYRK